LDSRRLRHRFKGLQVTGQEKGHGKVLAIPVLLVVAFLLPFLTGSTKANSTSNGLSIFLMGEISFILPIMLSSISVGQEGRSIANIYMLPIDAEQLIRGKIFLAWIVSGIRRRSSRCDAVIVSLTVVGFRMSTYRSNLRCRCRWICGSGSGFKIPQLHVGPEKTT